MIRVIKFIFLMMPMIWLIKFSFPEEKGGLSYQIHFFGETDEPVYQIFNSNWNMILFSGFWISLKKPMNRFFKFYTPIETGVLQWNLKFLWKTDRAVYQKNYYFPLSIFLINQSDLFIKEIFHGSRCCLYNRLGGGIITCWYLEWTAPLSALLRLSRNPILGFGLCWAEIVFLFLLGRPHMYLCCASFRSSASLSSLSRPCTRVLSHPRKGPYGAPVQKLKCWCLLGRGICPHFLYVYFHFDV